LEEIRMRETEGESLLTDRDGLEHTAIGQLLVHHLAFVLQRSPANKNHSKEVTGETIVSKEHSKGLIRATKGAEAATTDLFGFGLMQRML
jgi:hypothetical protein